MENIELANLRACCDTPGCDYEKEIDVSKLKEYIGIKCPKCNVVLIAQKEVDAFKEFKEFTDVMNDITKEAGMKTTSENVGSMSIKITAPKDTDENGKEEEIEK